MFNSCNSPLKRNKRNWDAITLAKPCTSQSILKCHGLGKLQFAESMDDLLLSKSSYDEPRSRLGLNFVQGTQKLCLNLAWLHRRSESIFLKVVSASKHSSKTVKVYLHFCRKSIQTNNLNF
jgi:hypothetical protein